MRVITSILVLFVLVAGCGRHQDSDETMHKRLAGVWLGEHKYSSGPDSTQTMRVAADGTFATVISIPKRKFGPRTIEQSGIWRIDDGVFILTTTKDSQTNASVPNVTRLKIVDVDDSKLELAFAQNPGGIRYPTNHIIFRKQPR